MLQIARRTTSGAVILLIMPFLVWLSGWKWQPQETGNWLKVFYWITETVTFPWGILSSIILSIWMLWCLRFRLWPAIILLLIINGSILAGQYTKTFIKNQIKEPRPYVIWLGQHHDINQEAFYALKRKQRSTLVNTLLQQDRQQPVWLKKHWAYETGYAFPSGHTVFAASWALLAIGLLWPRRHIKTVMLLLIWAITVMGSRLLLGMHWPRDLIMATLISWLLVTIACWLVQRLCGPLTVTEEDQKEIRTRRKWR